MKPKHARAVAVAAVALALPLAGASAQSMDMSGAARGVPDTTTGPAGNVTTLGAPSERPDTGMIQALTASEFVQLAANSGYFEVESSRLAADKATRDPVRNFAARMIQDHTTVNQQLASLARAQGIEPPMAPNAAQQQKIAAMQSLSGAAFERTYMTEQVAAHQEAVRLFETANMSDAPDMQPMRPLLARALPVLREHLMMAQSLAGTGAPMVMQ